MLTRRKVLAAALAVPAGVAVGATLHSLQRVQDVLVDVSPPPAGRPTGPSDRLLLREQPFFWAGLNYPWKTGQDFGTGGWGHSGVSEPTTYQEIDIDFANMAAQGVRIVKWRVFSDGRYSPEFSDDGTVTGFDEYFLPDIDAALEIAKRHDIYLILTLFSSGFWTADCAQGEVHLGGHAATLSDTAKRRTLVDRAVVPLLDHVASSDRVLAFEVIAEPEWGIQELNAQADARIKLPRSVIHDFLDETVRAIHQHSPSLATVESNRFSNMQTWQGLHLDYYSFSWYDWLEPYEPLATPADAARLDRPIVLGEFPASGSAYYSLPQILDGATGSGYAGAFAWSFWGGDGLSQWRSAAPEFAGWTRRNWELVNLFGAAPPADPLPPEVTYPYSIKDVSVRLDNAGVVAEMKVNVASGEPYVPHGYLYAIGNTQPLQDVRLTAAPGKPGVLEARFPGVDSVQTYSVSLGIFNREGALRKWFGDVAKFAVHDGTLVPPAIDPLTTELGCGA